MLLSGRRECIISFSRVVDYTYLPGQLLSILLLEAAEFYRAYLYDSAYYCL